MALCAAGLVDVGLPSSAFKARAVVAVTDIASPFSLILPKAAADAAVSEPVMVRAAQSLIGTNVPAPAPDLLERIAVALGLGGAHATGREARLAGDLVGVVTAKPGDVPGSLDISARALDAARAAQVANAVAEALVADQEETVGQARRKREGDAIALVERLKVQSAAARRRLMSLGGAELDPVQARATVAAQVANAQARVDTIRAIIASGAPPLSDRRDVPAGIETLQTTYLDLSRQLAKARETLGDRHTTILSLQEEVRHAAANLTAEWRRLAHLAEAELAGARQREATLRQADTPADATRRDAIEQARRGVQIADEAVARAQTAQHDPSIDERSYRLVAPATSPSATDGFAAPSRALIAGLVGLLAFAVVLRFPGSWAARLRSPRHAPRRRDEPIAARDAPPGLVPLRHRPVPQAQAADVALRRAMQRREDTMRHDGDVPAPAGAHDELMRFMVDLLPGLDAILPEFGTVPTVMVAANESAGGTTRVALTLGRAASDAGYRVLVVEVTPSRADLAAVADPDAAPALIDLFGKLRVVLPAAAADGVLYLAPNFENGARIASALARRSDTPLVDDIATEFDLVVIDGGRASDSAAAGWGADAYVRVGRVAAERDDDHFAATFGVSTAALLGTFVASVLPAKPHRKPMRSPSGLGAPFETSPVGRSPFRPPNAGAPDAAAAIYGLANFGATAARNPQATPQGPAQASRGPQSRRASRRTMGSRFGASAR